MSNRLVSCKCIPVRLASRVVAAMLDRLRLPWRGGAKRILLDALLPVVLLPALGLCAAQCVWASLLVFTCLIPGLAYLHLLCARAHYTTKFFAVWALVSLVVEFAVFELIVVQMLEIRTDENVSFYLLTLLFCFCVLKTKSKAEMSFVRGEGGGSKSGGDEMCGVCRKSVPARTFHCHICHTCVVKRDLHCAWLDCCIGETNHRWYMLSLLTLIAQLALCSNLILTTACHPFIVLGSIMLPDDCSDVYYDILYALCFVLALYCLFCLIFALALLVHETWLISIGVTGDEWRVMRSIGGTSRSCGTWCCGGSRACGTWCGLLGDRPHSHGFLTNWKLYLKGQADD